MKTTLRAPFAAFALGALALAVAACGKDSTSPEPQLDQIASIEIAYELMFTVLSIGFGALGSEVHDAGAAAPALFGLQPPQAISETVPCEQGGTIAVSGTITDDLDEQGSGTYSLDLRQTPNNCAMQTSNGIFTINGDPNLHITATIAATDWFQFGTFTLSYDGGFTWTGGGGSGGCSMNVTYAIDYANPAATTVSGHMCGFDVSG